ncbi:OadG family transporter subunit [Halomonas vilamensis]|uniref:Probable oxaloacetate decarboxylase gamma chain n=1 Tax=Vreelandella vilamensis TaxID=531309 RepID=A0ABU1H4E1_9GAMM|nr:OadG family transporter subunit [Halomonas vilamensis]MDR5899178.1 OadG family transporter subunit [Halomonas vilamensis]
MQNAELLNEGLALMALGMGFVFIFLTVLVISVTLMSSIVRRFQPAPAPSAPARRAPPASSAQNDEVQAVISAAVHRYRRQKGRES